MGADILTEKLATALSTDNAPDLVFQFNLQVGLHGKNGTMRDLSDFWEKKPALTKVISWKILSPPFSMKASRSCFPSTGILPICIGTKTCSRPPA